MLRITEVFCSLQGESRSSGLLTTFVRLTGCPLRCGYCDSAYAFSGGEMRSLADIVAHVAELGARYVTVTGGEPLAQPDARQLMVNLCDAGHEVSLETSGALSIADIDTRVSIVMDLKTPGSGEMARNDLRNIEKLRASDQVKFVLCDRADYEWARMMVDSHQLHDRVAEVLFSPSATELPLRDLADWVVHDRLAVRVQAQLHKAIWGDEPGR